MSTGCAMRTETGGGVLLLRKRDVLAVSGMSEWKYKTLVETGALRALSQRGNRKRLFSASEVAKVME